MRKFLALLLLAPSLALAATTATVTPGDWPLYRGTTIVSRHADLDNAHQRRHYRACEVRLINFRKAFLSLLLAATPAFAPAQPAPPAGGWTGDATFDWDAVTTNTDGTPVRAPVTYELRLTPTGAARTVSGPPVTFDALPAGTHCGRVIAIDSAGARSDPSNEACKTLAAPPPTCTTPQPAAETRSQSCAAPAMGSWSQARTYAAAPYPTCWQAGAWTPAAAPAGACVVPAPVPRVVAAVPGLSHAVVFGITASSGRGSTVLGFVPVGTECTGPVVYRYRGRDYRRIAPASVVWWQSTATTNAAAPCQ